MGDLIRIWKLPASQADGPERIQWNAQPRSLDEGSRYLPGGGYTTFRTFGKFRVLRLADHYERLEETARLAGKPLQVDRARLKAALQQVLADYPAEEARVRVTLDLEQQVGDLYILLEPLHTPPPNAYQEGVRVVTRHLQRENPKAKLTGFIEKASAVRQSLPPGINEAIMIGEDGRALEGLSSNFFAVKDGVIWTAETGVLSGITRSLVLEVIAEKGVPCRLEGAWAEDLPYLDEALITSASRAVLPVTEIDGKKIGDGKPGPITRALLEGYLARIEPELDTV